MKTWAIVIVLLLSVVFIIGCSDQISNTENDGIGKIILTEIMYNNGIDTLEFIELKNPHSSNMPLKGMLFSEGIQYQFPDSALIASGQYVVLTNSRELFHLHYPDVAIGGVFGGRLNNSGEKIELTAGDLKRVFSISYHCDGFWPSLADGLGYSLVTVDENGSGDQNNYNHWCASLKRFGSPGRSDNAHTHDSVYVNEIVTSGLLNRVDKIELYNPSKVNAVDISNWFLTDDRKNPKKFRIPSGTIIQPNGYSIFTADQFKDFMSITINGGSVYLFSANADSNYTGFSHGIDYEDSQIGASFGLICNSDGFYLPCHLNEPTIGSANSKPVMGSVVISEIMYNPTSSGVEFVEITNITDDTVNLFSQETFWKISGISFDFTSAVTLKKGGVLLLINSSASVSTFRTLNHIDSSVIVLQFTGKLSNNGELIAIERYGNAWVDNLGEIRYSAITVDAVAYKDSSPWPKSADGEGYSLVRKDLKAWGNEPLNWKSSDNIGGSPGKT